MTDTSNNAPERIWAFHAGPMVGLFIGKKEVGVNIREYIRKDIADAENERLRKLLSEAESDLRSQAEHDAPEDQRVYPSMQRRYNQDIDLPNRIRDALNQERG